MTQLFDTATYDNNPEPERHLRSVRNHPGAPATPHGPSWRLDDQTIAIGRKGIERAREALRNSAKETDSTDRKAA